MTELFLFQTGAIKRLIHYHQQQCLQCFYSKLVRLKVYPYPDDKVQNRISFYSKLVRLKGISVARAMHQKEEVSIPNWCD